MLKVQEFIKAHSDWRELLARAPYMVSCSEDTMFGRHLVCLKYSQIASDFSLEIVKECRGLILDADTAEIVAYPFYKFFNFGEANAATDSIDWGSAYVTEKLDGSIIKVVRLGDDFLISTNGVVDAFKCNLPSQMGCPFNSFGELVMEGFKFYGIGKDDFKDLFQEGFTYMFELTSPWNQVVVQWSDTKMNLIGIRDNASCQEIFYKNHPLAKVFNTPKIFAIHTIDDCVAAATVLPDNAEGYVVCDAHFNRIKVKSPKYVQLHYMASNQSWGAERVLDIFRAGEVGEYVTYFPQFKVAFDRVKDAYDSFVARAVDFQASYDSFVQGGKSKKDVALWVFGDADRKVFSDFAFKLYDAKVSDAKGWVDGILSSKLVEVLGLK